MEHETSGLRPVHPKRSHGALRIVRRRRSHRPRRWLIQHRDSGVRAALGAGLLVGVWLLWPEPRYQALDQASTVHQPAGDISLSDGLVPAAQASVDVSAKRRLAGEAGAVQARLKQSLRQVAKTMPDIGMPHQPRLDRPTPEGNTPVELLYPALPEITAAAGHPSAAVAEHRGPGEPAAVDPLSDDAPVGRAGAAAEPATAAALENGLASRVGSLRPEIAPDVIEINPAAAPARPEQSDQPRHSQTVALLDVPADMLAPDTGQRRTPTWLRNAVESVVDARPAIAVVIDDLGLNRRGTAALNRLRAPLTLAFLPYATDLDEQTRAARAAGHELMVHVPMEPRSADWPGPNALTSQLGPDELVSRLRSHLRSFRGFVGVNNHMGSLLTADPERMAILMAELRQRELLFLDSRTTPESVAAHEAERSHVPFAERDVFIDNDLELESVLRALAHAENIARRQGYAVAMGHPHDVTIEALKRWLPTLDARGIALVPISAVVARQSCANGLILVGNACARYAVAHSAVQ
jgi:uncharacterized protein